MMTVENHSAPRKTITGERSEGGISKWFYHRLLINVYDYVLVQQTVLYVCQGSIVNFTYP